VLQPEIGLGERSGRGRRAGMAWVTAVNPLPLRRPCHTLRAKEADVAKDDHGRRGGKKSSETVAGKLAAPRAAAPPAPVPVESENKAARAAASEAVARQRKLLRSKETQRESKTVAKVDSFDKSSGDLEQLRRPKLDPKFYDKELARLQVELVKLQEWVKANGLKVVMLFEGRDAAGKGGTIKRVTEALNPRVCRIVALGVPTDREKSQWYFQRYVAELPAAGEMCVFDRSWYNRAGVEHVMGFCTQAEYDEFLRTAPEFERMLIRSGIILIKFWFSVSDEEQERRFQDRINDPTKRWKISPMDVTARSKWVEYSKAKDAMFDATDTPEAPWWVVEADDKERARLNCIAHILSLIPYQDTTQPKIVLPPRQVDDGYVRPPISVQHFVPEKY
jgi:polyphosphate kinase